MTKLVTAYVRVLKMFLFLLAMLMVGMVFVNFVLRYGFSSGIAASEELSRWALVWAAFVGATIAMIERRHLSVKLVVDLLPPRAALVTVLIAQALCLAISIFLVVGLYKQVGLNMAMKGPVTGLPYGVMLYGGGLFFAVHAVATIAAQMVWAVKTRARRWQEN